MTVGVDTVEGSEVGVLTGSAVVAVLVVGAALVVDGSVDVGTDDGLVAGLAVPGSAVGGPARLVAGAGSTSP